MADAHELIYIDTASLSRSVDCVCHQRQHWQRFERPGKCFVDSDCVRLLHSTSVEKRSDPCRYFLAMTCSQPLYGKLSDIFGRKPCLLFAYSLFGLGCLGCGLAQTMIALVLARVGLQDRLVFSLRY